MSLVIDTGVLVAAAHVDDPDHASCQELLAATTELRRVPAPVLVEADQLLRGSRAWLRLLDDILVGAVVVVDLVPDDYARARQLQERYADLRVGFVDCAVLAVVERLSEPKLATLDERHFRVMRPTHVKSLQLLPMDVDVG